MIGFFRSVAEAVVEKGVRGLLEEVPFGRFFCDVAERVAEKEKARHHRGQLRVEFERVVVLSHEAARDEARAAFAEVVRRRGLALPPAEVEAAAEWMAGIPEAARVSNRRPDDPAGRTLSAAFALDTPDDVLRVLPPRPPRFQTGQTVPGRDGEWLLDRVLGAGGFGEVWLTRHAHDYHAPRAVKFFFDQTGKDVQREADLVKRAMAAGQADTARDDPRRHIVPILDVRLAGDAPWLMFEYVGGGNLSGWLYELAGATADARVRQVVTALKQLCRGVGVFHGLSTPLAHRDLKPSNVLIDAPTGRLRITDFGIGAVTQKAANARENRGESSKGERLTSYLRGAHTPTYSSPEQRLGADPDPRDDVHALGVIGYQLLIGDLSAAPGVDLADDLRDAGTPAELIDAIAACVARKRDRRPADARDLGARLDAVGSARATTGPSPAPATALPAPPPPARQGPRPGEERRVAIPGGLEMVFCWVPAGTCQLGSPRAEQGAVAAAMGQREDGLTAESETKRGGYTSKGFWLGKYPVTQTEWRAVTGESPSRFQAGAGGAAEVRGMGTGRFPVESVSWDMCQAFLGRLNAVAKVGAEFRPAYRFALPHEDQWEYACRGGKGNEQPFYWGGELTGRQANINGNYAYPAGNPTKVENLKRPCPVEFANGGTYPAHPWGLLHMVGNVWEWCENNYEQTGSKVLRGGSWTCAGIECRSANRVRLSSEDRGRDTGCRLVLA